MGNSPSEPLSFQWQSRITRTSIGAKRNQLSRAHIMKVVPYLQNITNVLTLGAVSKKCASSILLSPVNPFFSTSSVLSELSIFSGARLLRMDLKTALAVSLPHDATIEIMMSFIEFTDPIDWSKISGITATLEMQLCREVEIPFKNFSELRKVKFSIWEQLSRSYTEQLVESLIYCEKLKVCIFEVEASTLTCMAYGINQLLSKHITVIVKARNAKDLVSEIKATDQFQMCTYSNELHKSIAEGKVILLPDESNTVQLCTSLASCKSSLDRVMSLYIPPSVEIKGIPQPRKSTSKKSVQGRPNSVSITTDVIQSLELENFTFLRSLQLNGVRIVNKRQFTLPTSLTALTLTLCNDTRRIIIPSSIDTLSINNCPSLSSIQSPPQAVLRSLSIEHCNTLKELNCPTLLSSLELKFCTTLTQLNNPSYLVALELQNCPSLKQFSPCTLTKLSIHNTPIVNINELLPCTLADLRLSSIHLPKSITLPTLVTRLEIQNCEGLTRISNISQCIHLTEQTVKRYSKLSRSISKLK